MTDDLTDLPADEGDLPLDDPSNIGGPVLVDYETGEVHDLPPDAALLGVYSPPPGYADEEQAAPPIFAGMSTLLGTMARENADMPDPVPYEPAPWPEHAPPPVREVD